jgi:transcription elongation factor B subunit 1
MGGQDESELTGYVTLVSSDGYEFKILRSAACLAGTIKNSLDPTCKLRPTQEFVIYTDFGVLDGFREGSENRVDLPTIKYA